MNYIYDILINLQKKLYDFYEWNHSDEILHVRKIPIFTIDSDDLYNIKNNVVKFDASFLNKISNRCEIFTNKNVKIMKYVCLISDTNEIIVIEITGDGYKNRSSKLLIDEELDVIEVSENIDKEKIDYKIEQCEDINCFKTRKELKINDYINRHLKEDNYDKLKYLYLECFDKEESDIKKITDDINRELNENWNRTYKKVYDFFRLSSQRQ